MPASADTVAEFLKVQSEKAPATISRRRAAIGKIHRLLNLENPARAEDVVLAERTVLRQKGRRQKQALGLTDTLKRRLMNACSSDLAGLRDQALIATGYDTLCRRSELVALRVLDFTVNRDGSGVVLVRRSKADQFGAGRLAYLSSETVTLLNRWCEAANIDQGPIFRRIRGRQVEDGHLHPSCVALIIKLRAAKAQLDQAQVSKLSGHSMRVGAAQDMAAAGIELGAIMHAGGWKSPEMVMRYIEHMDVQKSGMARLYGATPQTNRHSLKP